MKKGIVVEFATESSKEFKERYNKIHNDFHILYKSCDECLDESLKLYSMIDNNDLIASNSHKFSLLHFILNIMSEKAIEEKSFDISEEKFFQSYYELAKQYISNEDEEMRIVWLKTKALAVMKLEIFDLVITRYKKIEKYFANKIKDINFIDDIVLNYKNLCEVRKEIAIFSSNKNEELFQLYVSKAIIGYINLYNDNNISKDVLKNICDILRIESNDSCEILINGILNSNKIAL